MNTYIYTQTYWPCRCCIIHAFLLIYTQQCVTITLSPLNTNMYMYSQTHMYSDDTAAYKCVAA